MGAQPDWIIVGLGNPGQQYTRTRHNIGAEAVKRLAEECHADPLKSRHSCELWQAELPAQAGDSASLLLAVPIAYMNQSGKPVSKLTKCFGLRNPEQLVIVHDELDLPPGRMRLKLGGGLGGHNGLTDIRTQLRTADFTRIRLGVGKPPSKEQGAQYVLARPSPAERELLDDATRQAMESIREMVANGLAAAVSRQS